METRAHDTTSAPTSRSTSPLRRLRERARAQDIVTEEGFRQGYIALKPSRWLGRFFPDLVRLNEALHHLESNSLTLLGSRGGDFAGLAQAFLGELQEYRSTTRRLTRRATQLALGHGQAAEVEHPEDTPTLEEDLAAWQAPFLAEEHAQANGQEGH